jgi:hypothetical protein
MFDLAARIQDGLTTLIVTDAHNHIVATGTGKDIHEAHQHALETTDDESVRVHLRGVALLTAPFE